MDGWLPSPGWSATIPRTRWVTHDPQDGNLSALGWSPIIQNYHYFEHILSRLTPAVSGEIFS